MRGVEVAMLAEYICSGVCLETSSTESVLAISDSLIWGHRRVLVTETGYFLPLQ